MASLTGAFRTIAAQKEKFALIFSLVALLGSYGKGAIEFLWPTDQLIVIVSSDKTPNEDRNPFPISKEKHTLRLDPRLPLSFINNSPNYILVKHVELTSPTLSAKRVSKNRCDVDNFRNMEMFKFELSEAKSTDAAPFSVAPGQILSIRIAFAGIADIKSKEVDISKGIPICLHLELFDYKGRSHDFLTHVFDITGGDETQTSYNTRMEDKGIVALRFNQLWSILH